MGRVKRNPSKTEPRSCGYSRAVWRSLPSWRGWLFGLGVMGFGYRLYPSELRATSYYHHDHLGTPIQRGVTRRMGCTCLQSHALRQSKYPCIPHVFAVHHPALPRQNRAKLHNARDYANKQSGFAVRFAAFVRIIGTMQNGTCFAGAHPVGLTVHPRSQP
jgi:hypothetical protein